MNTIHLSTPFILGLSRAFDAFSATKQDLKNFEVYIEEKDIPQSENAHERKHISITFAAKALPGQRGLGNISTLGKTVTYVTSPENGEIINEYGCR